MTDKTDPIGDIEVISFYKLMQLLCPPNDQFHGCETLFVDTAFFDNKTGKAVEMIFTNKDGFLCNTKSEKRLKYTAIQMHFTDIARERRKAQVPLNRETYEEDRLFDR